MILAATILSVVVLASVVALILSERYQWRPGLWGFKPLASGILVLIAALLGSNDIPYTRIILAAMALSFVGDVLLIPRGRKWAFLAGIVAFLLAHVVYVVAFAQFGINWLQFTITLAALALPAVPAARWLRPHTDGPMSIAVLLYIGVITIMLATAIAATLRGGFWPLFIGAFLFYVSDLFVARQRFVTQAFINRAVGLPLYFAGQLILVWTAGWWRFIAF